MADEAGFFWGAPHDVPEAENAFVLVNPETGGLPPVARRIVAPAGCAVLAGVLPPDLSAPREEQARAIFVELERRLAALGATWGNVVRTWFYVDDVCAWYGAFNAARSDYFARHGVFETFLPASTGIGSANRAGAALCAGALVQFAGRKEIVDSPLQAPAMAYRSSFSRAAEVFAPDGSRTLFVSGTASIEPNSHAVAFVGDVDRQIACTMRAVEAILVSRGHSWRTLTRAVAYLKKPEFLAAWRAWQRANPEFPAAVAAETACDVCRDEWLFEIECDSRVD